MFTYVFICSYVECMPKVMCCHNLTVNRGKIEKKSLFLSDCMGRVWEPVSFWTFPSQAPSPQS